MRPDEIDEGRPEFCKCGSELRLTRNRKRNRHVRGVGYEVKYDRQYKCDSCHRIKDITSDGETWNPYEMQRKSQ